MRDRKHFFADLYIYMIIEAKNNHLTPCVVRGNDRDDSSV